MSARRLGFTLLEVILALAISAVVLAMVGSGIRLQMRMVDGQGNAVEQAELARAIMGQISRELQSIVAASEVANLGGAGSTSSTADSATAAGGATDGGTTGASSSGAASSDTAAGQTIDPTLQTAIGLYGDRSYLRFETDAAISLSTNNVSDPNVASTSFGSASASRSELRTVSYFLGTQATGQQSSPVVGNSLGSALNSENSSLIRSVLDYQTHSFLLENGGLQMTQGYATEFAPEVQDLLFRYFDGIQWLDQWDSVAQGGLPLAVECTIVLSPVADDADAAVSEQEVSSGQWSDLMYTTIIRLPVVPMTFDSAQF